MSFAAKFAPKSQKGNFVTQIVRENAYVLELRAVQNGREVFFILHLHKSKFEAFKELWDQKAAMNLEDFGTVLHKGIGAPSAAIKAEMREKYGMYED